MPETTVPLKPPFVMWHLERMAEEAEALHPDWAAKCRVIAQFWHNGGVDRQRLEGDVERLRRYADNADAWLAGAGEFAAFRDHCGREGIKTP